MSSARPTDRYYTALSIVCLLGVASLLPWNVLITQAQYLNVRSHKDGARSGSWWADQIVSLTANCYLFFNLAAFLVLLPLGKHVSIHRQISVPLSLSAILVLVQAWIAYETRLPGPYFIANTLISTALLGAATAPMTSATYALASFLPPVYIQALVFGQSMAGVATSVLSLVTIWASPPSIHELPTADDVGRPAILYFFACGIVVLLGILGYWGMSHLSYVQYWTLKEGPPTEEDIQFSPLAEDGEANMQMAIKSMVNKHKAGEIRRLLSVPSAQMIRESGEDGHEISVLELSKKLRGYDYIVGLAFLVSLAAFPGNALLGLVALVCSAQNGAVLAPCHPDPPAGRFYGDLFQPFIFLLFNAGDAAGRALAGLHIQPVSSAALFTYAALRVLIVIGIALCKIVPSSPWLLPVILGSDFFPAALSGILGLTNGHLATIAMIHAPKLVPSVLRDRTGTLLSFSLSAGLTIGSFFSIIILSGLQSSSQSR